MIWYSMSKGFYYLKHTIFYLESEGYSTIFISNCIFSTNYRLIAQFKTFKPYIRGIKDKNNNKTFGSLVGVYFERTL